MGDSILGRVRTANQTVYTDLQSFVCDERVDRFRGGLQSVSGRHIDTLSAHVSFENGMEHYSDVRQDSRARPNFASVSGAWSEGEFGTLLRQTQQLVSVVQPGRLETSEWNGEAATVLSFDVPSGNSPWTLVIEDGGARRLAFHTTVWVANESGRIVRVVRTSSDIPAHFGISAIEWSLGLQWIKVRDSVWLVPDSGEYSVEYGALRKREWNRISFSNYRRYGSEVAIRFEALR